MTERSGLELFYVGTVDIALDTVLDSPAARTPAIVLGSASLGGEISVEVEQHEWDPDWDEHADPEELFDRESVEIWVEVLRRMRAMLASCMILCEMRPLVEVHSSPFHPGSELDEENAKAAIELLGEGFFRTTPAMAIEALRERTASEEALTGGLRLLLEAMEQSDARTLGELMDEGEGEEG